MAELVRERAARLDLARLREGLRGKGQALRAARELRVEFPEATEIRERRVDVSYTLPHDIRDEKGELISPPGIVSIRSTTSRWRTPWWKA